MSNKSYDIHERIFNYVVAVVTFLNKLPKTPTNLIFINQVTRSVTSMGANEVNYVQYTGILDIVFVS